MWPARQHVAVTGGVAVGLAGGGVGGGGTDQGRTGRVRHVEPPGEQNHAAAGPGYGQRDFLLCQALTPTVRQRSQSILAEFPQLYSISVPLHQASCSH